jgi:hypothetical protein
MAAALPESSVSLTMATVTVLALVMRRGGTEPGPTCRWRRS